MVEVLPTIQPSSGETILMPEKLVWLNVLLPDDLSAGPGRARLPKRSVARSAIKRTAASEAAPEKMRRSGRRVGSGPAGVNGVVGVVSSVGADGSVLGSSSMISSVRSGVNAVGPKCRRRAIVSWE